MRRFLYGRTVRCCKCYAIATQWAGGLIKGRDAVRAGWCEKHFDAQKNDKVCYGIYNKNMEFTEQKLETETVSARYGLSKNTIEQ